MEAPASPIKLATKEAVSPQKKQQAKSSSKNENLKTTPSVQEKKVEQVVKA